MNYSYFFIKINKVIKSHNCKVCLFYTPFEGKLRIITKAFVSTFYVFEIPAVKGFYAKLDFDN